MARKIAKYERIFLAPNSRSGCSFDLNLQRAIIMKSDHLDPKTQRKYLSFASGFYAKWILDGNITPARILEALKHAAPDYRPASFRVLKNAIAFDQDLKGYKSAAKKILEFKNPVTAHGSHQKPKPKIKKVKALRGKDFWLLVESLTAKGCHEEVASLMLAWICGVRPCEIRTIFVDADKVYVSGGKKSHAGLRGADRVLDVEDEDVLATVGFCADLMRASSRSASTIRDRVRQEAKLLWPRRKNLPTLYSLRHQFGANLKAAGLDDRVRSYLMGHQSTQSIQVYGDKRVGDASSIKVKPVNGVDYSMIRAKISSPPFAKPTKVFRVNSGIGLQM